MPSAVSIKNLRFGYGREEILQGVTLEVPENSFLVVIGPNGGGKSTLLKLMLGLLAPEKGAIRLLGEPVEKALPNVGYVPQDTGQIRNFPVNALDTVKMSLYRPGVRMDKKTIESAAKNALERMGVQDLAAKRLNAISSGQRQRVLIARAIAAKPRLLMLDEPISAIDPAGQTIILNALKDLLPATTIIFVSHDLSVIPGYATAVACVNRDLHYHPHGELTASLVSQAYGDLASLALVSHECACGENHG